MSANKKVTKEVAYEGAELLAPAIKAAPYGMERSAVVFVGAGVLDSPDAPVGGAVGELVFTPPAAGAATSP